MPIRRRSPPRRRALLPLAAVTTLAMAPAPMSVAAPNSSTGAAAAIEAQGHTVLERLRAAITRQRGSAPPIILQKPAPVSMDVRARQRAIEAVRAGTQDPAMATRARRAASLGAEGLARERSAMAREVGQALGLQPPDVTAIAQAEPSLVAASWSPLLFVSSSMPIDELRTYAAQLEKVRGAFAFRGMPGGLHHIGPMARLSAEILRLDLGCEGPACTMRNVPILVDPIAFRTHGVDRVPALAMVPGDPGQPYCERDAAAPPGPIVYGDAALSGLLQDYARLGGKEQVHDAETRLQGR